MHSQHYHRPYIPEVGGAKIKSDLVLVTWPAGLHVLREFSAIVTEVNTTVIPMVFCLLLFLYSDIKCSQGKK